MLTGRRDHLVQVGAHRAGDDVTNAQAVELADLHGDGGIKGQRGDDAAHLGARLDPRRSNTDGDDVVLQRHQVATLAGQVLEIGIDAMDFPTQPLLRQVVATLAPRLAAVDDARPFDLVDAHGVAGVIAVVVDQHLVGAPVLRLIDEADAVGVAASPRASSRRRSPTSCAA